jgi:hypothetical protein
LATLVVPGWTWQDLADRDVGWMFCCGGEQFHGLIVAPPRRAPRRHERKAGEVAATRQDDIPVRRWCAPHDRTRFACGSFEVRHCSISLCESRAGRYARFTIRVHGLDCLAFTR